MRRFIVTILFILIPNLVYAGLTPFTAPADVHPAGIVRLAISLPGTTTSIVLVSTANGGLVQGSSNGTYNIVANTEDCPLPNNVSAPCLRLGDFDIFLSTDGQIAVLTGTSPSGASTTVSQIKLQNTKVVRRRAASSFNQIKFELSTTISGIDVTTPRAHGSALSGIFYRNVTQSDGTVKAATASSAFGGSPTITADAATLTGSFVYLKDATGCTSDPAPSNCLGGRTNYRTDSYPVNSGSLSNNTIKFSGPIFLQDTLTPSAVTCVDAFSNGTNCHSVEHLRMAATFTLSKPSTISALNTLAGCSKAPCQTLDYLDISSTGSGVGAVTEDVVFLGGVNLVINPPPGALNPGDNGTFQVDVISTPQINVATCDCSTVRLSPGDVRPTQCNFNININDVSPLDARFKFKNEEIDVECTAAPQTTVVVTAVCTALVTSTETTSGRGHQTNSTPISEYVTGTVEGRAQVPVTPCN